MPPAFGGSTIVAPSIAIQPDGKILVGGSRDFVGGLVITLHYSELVRFDTKGVLDPAFSPGNLEEGLATIVSQPDGKILAEVVGGPLAGPVRTVSRLLPDGTLDPAFGVGGTASGIGGALAVQANGKIVTAETTTVGTATGSRTAFKLSRYEITGALDTSFGSGGTVVTQIEANNAAGAVAIQPDGRIVVVATKPRIRTLLSSVGHCQRRRDPVLGRSVSSP